MSLAVAFGMAEAMAVGHKTIVESELGGRHGPHAHFRDRLADDESLEILLDQKDRELLLRAGAGEHREEIGHRRRGDPHLLTFEKIAAVDLARRGGDAAEIAAGIRLGHADATDLLATQRRREQA